MSKTEPDSGATLVAIDFHGDQLVTCQHLGEPHVAMRHVVENIGLSWGSQFAKLSDSAAKFRCVDIETPDHRGRMQVHLCIPVAKLPLWLASINPNKVPDPDKRAKLELYQEESAIALHDYWSKGFALNKRLLETDEHARDDLAAQLRQLRLSDKALHKKLTDTIAATSSDYAAAKLIAPKRINALFIRIQDTFHVAVTGKTAQELVIENADGRKPLVGMKSFAGNPNRITKQDVRTGKNYLEEIPFRKLAILYEQLLLIGEHRVLSGERLTLDAWAEQIDSLLVTMGYQPWRLYSSYKAAEADEAAARELAIYKKRIAPPPAVPTRLS